MFKLFTVLTTCFFACCASLPAQEPTASQIKKIAQVKTLMDDAGRLYKNGSFTWCVKKVESAKELVSELVASGNAKVIEKLADDYGRISKAQELLVAKGQKLNDLLPLQKMGTLAKTKRSDGDSKPAMDSTKNGDANQISFTKQVAPILVQHCGQCHVRGAKGGFSAANFLAASSKSGSPLSPNRSKSSVPGAMCSSFPFATPRTA